MKLELTLQEVQLIGEGLSVMAYGRVASLVQKIQKQVTEQQSDLKQSS